jgi:hypothetical protein
VPRRPTDPVADCHDRTTTPRTRTSPRGPRGPLVGRAATRRVNRGVATKPMPPANAGKGSPRRAGSPLLPLRTGTPPRRQPGQRGRRARRTRERRISARGTHVRRTSARRTPGRRIPARRSHGRRSRARRESAAREGRARTGRRPPRPASHRTRRIAAPTPRPAGGYWPSTVRCARTASGSSRRE